MNTIVALATPALKSALAVIRVCGDEAFSITEKLSGKKIAGTTNKKLVYSSLSFDDKLIDQVMLLVYPSSSSMTGEDTVEITCHGSMVIAKEIIAAYLALGATYAGPGEFSSRAYFHGKMDLIEAEAINDLINATTKESKNIALYSLSGKTSKLLYPLKEDLGAVLALIEVGIDFPEYDEEEKATLPSIASSCEEIRKKIAELIQGGEQGKVVRAGIKIAIVGEPNVGKSSLLNALLEEDKALVSPIPGTTRDVVEGEISVHGIPVRLLDTAGLHETEDYVEGLGIAKSEKMIEEADLVLLVYENEIDDKAKEVKERYGASKKIIEICNKSDLVADKKEGVIYASAIKGDVEAVKKAIYDSLGLSDDVFETPSLSNERELALLRRMDKELSEAIDSCKREDPIDLVSAFVQEAYHLLQQLLGEEQSYDLTDEIFSRFCVGK